MTDADITPMSAHHDAPPPDQETLDRLHISAVLGQFFELNIKPEDVLDRRDEILDLLEKRGFARMNDAGLDFLAKKVDQAAEDKMLEDEDTVMGTA
jgi:hypothetical protein